MSPTRPLRAAALALALCLTPAVSSAQNDPGAGDRSMAFRPVTGAQERVPGGRLVVTAYAAVLLLLGGYVAFIARKASRLEDDVRRLEDDLARRAPGEQP